MPDVILDRDGVINFESRHYIKSPTEWHAIPGSLQAIARLNDAGFRVFVATNQSGVARGYYSHDVLTAIHEKFKQQLHEVGGEVTDIIYCPHHPDDFCLCRKPNPGMLLQIKKKHNVLLEQAFFVGDSYVDIKAAQTAGCQPLLVMTGNGRKTLLHYPQCQSVPQFENLVKVVDYIISKNKTS